MVARKIQKQLLFGIARNATLSRLRPGGGTVKKFSATLVSRRAGSRLVLIEISPVRLGIIFHRPATYGEPMRNTRDLPGTARRQKVGEKTDLSGNVAETELRCRIPALR